MFYKIGDAKKYWEPVEAAAVRGKVPSPEAAREGRSERTWRGSRNGTLCVEP